MCGIAGIINFKPQSLDENDIRIMLKAMKYRGPDDEGTFVENHIGIGNVRLRILDLSPLGHQPMFDVSQRYVIAYNGEIFNYIELREELKKKGYQFKSNTDTEVVLNSFIEWGEACLNKFNGMWAFSIYDKKTKNIFIARDRFGIKPIYYYLDENRFVFASVIPAILSILDNKYSLNKQAIFEYLVLNRTDQTDDTFFSEINKLKHGHLIKIHNSKVTFARWYNLKENIKNPFNNSDEFGETLSSAIRLRLRSDVPVGVCLSGGLDSSSIVSILLNDCNSRNLNTFSAVYGKGQFGDESYYISEFKPYIDNMHFVFPSSKTFFSDIAQFMKAHGEPVLSTSPYAQFKVMELAKDYVTVTLDGQGADEQLAGYHYFFGFYFKDLLMQLRILKFLKEIYKSKNNHIYSGLRTFLYFLLPDNLRVRIQISQKGYIKKDFIKQYISKNQTTNNVYGLKSLRDSLVDHFEYKLEHMLKYEDRNSMWFSLESRVPFLDYRLVERTLALSEDMIINDGMTKFILRQAMKGKLPNKIRNRKDKIGFNTPADKWFRSKIFENLIKDIINEGYFFSTGILNKKKAFELYSKHLTMQIDISREIWKWLNLELWYRKYFAG